MKKLTFVWLIITGAFALLAGCGGGPDAPQALVDQPDGPTRAAKGLRKIIVFDAAVNEPARAAIIRGVGGVVVKDLPLVEGKAVILPNTAAERALEGRPEVVRVDNDDIYSISGSVSAAGKKPPPPPPAQSLPWGVNRIDADLAGATSKGTGVKVAILDTGIDLTHPDLKANIKGNYNAINPRKTGNDDNGHGTHVAGTVAAMDNTVGVIGVAPEVSLYAVKVLDRTGNGWTSDIIEGIDWCIRNGIQVINMSFGGSFNQSMGQAVYDAYAAGLVQVAAAGNSGVSPPVYPASYPETIAVSATDSADQLASFSNYGLAADDLAAPGVNIPSTWKGGGYRTLSGTSMATPHVTGAAALVIATGVTGPEAVRARLASTAENIGLDVSKQGAGLVDAEKAVTGP
jgi:subtilisin family serine protease